MQAQAVIWNWWRDKRGPKQYSGLNEEKHTGQSEACGKEQTYKQIYQIKTRYYSNISSRVKANTKQTEHYSETLLLYRQPFSDSFRYLDSQTLLYS